MSADKPKKSRSSSKATKADLEAKIAELEAKLNALAAQTKPAQKPETKPTPPPAPKPQVQQRPPPPPAPKEEPKRVEPPAQTSTAEVAAAYSTTSSSGYTGNRYYATRQRLAYHPPDKQYRGQVVTTVQVAPPAPAPAPEPEAPKEEPTPAPKEERRVTPPAPRVKYSGDNYYKTRQRLAYHPPDKQYKETVAVKFEEAPTVADVQSTQPSPQQEAKATSDKKSKTQQLAEYEKEYLERLEQQRAEAAKAAEESKPRGTMPAGWKPS